jgi:hypothetical protein
MQLWELVLQTYPARPWVLITENLTTHGSRETPAAWRAWPEVQLLWRPTYACWLNLIEPWWKQLRSLALKGRRFERINEVIAAMVQATMSWKAHRDPDVWKKAAQLWKRTIKIEQGKFSGDITIEDVQAGGSGGRLPNA